MPKVAFRTVRSRQRFANYAEVKKELAKTLDRVVKPHFIRRFDLVVMNWKHQPDFKARKFIRPDKIWLNVFPAGDKEDKDIYFFVTKGTKPHRIAARRAPRLAFMWGGVGSYKPKTAPRGKIGGPGIIVGGTLHRPVAVQHPGTEARDFEGVIAEDEKRWYSRTMENAWRRAIRKL
jgi:hypothetical protein